MWAILNVDLGSSDYIVPQLSGSRNGQSLELVALAAMRTLDSDPLHTPIRG
jgi:hypothetical protein